MKVATQLFLKKTLDLIKKERKGTKKYPFFLKKRPAIYKKMQIGGGVRKNWEKQVNKTTARAQFSADFRHVKTSLKSFSKS